MPQSDTKAEAGPDSPADSPIARAVMARLPEADRQRLSAWRRALYQRLGSLFAAALVLVACMGPLSSNAATHFLALLIGALEAWRALVSVLLGGLMLVPVLSALCMFGLSILLWQRLIDSQGHQLP
jgi:hypothetical protein